MCRAGQGGDDRIPCPVAVPRLDEGTECRNRLAPAIRQRMPLRLIRRVTRPLVAPPTRVDRDALFLEGVGAHAKAVPSEEGGFAPGFGPVPLCAVTQVTQRPDHPGDAVRIVAQGIAVLPEPVRRYRMTRGYAKMLAGAAGTGAGGESPGFQDRGRTDRPEPARPPPCDPGARHRSRDARAFSSLDRPDPGAARPRRTPWRSAGAGWRRIIDCPASRRPRTGPGLEAGPATPPTSACWRAARSRAPPRRRSRAG